MKMHTSIGMPMEPNISQESFDAILRASRIQSQAGFEQLSGLAFDVRIASS